MPCPPSCPVVAFLVLTLVVSYTAALDVSIPFTVPPHAQPLSQTLLSFSIELDRWPDWTGVDARNNFTYAALSNLAELTGKPPGIRVGANSVDRTTWSPTETLNEDAFPPPSTVTPFPEATKIVVGDDFYKLSRYLPQGTHMVWGVNLGANNTTNAFNMAEAIAKSYEDSAVKAAGIVLDRIEVGNEPDLYANNGLRPGNYTVDQYVSEWEANVGVVVQALGISGRNGSVTIQGAAFANQGFTPRQIFDIGILNSTGGQAISTISQHHYSGFFCNGGNMPLTSFLNKTAIRGNLSIFEQDINATRARGLDYILGETNSIACHGAPGVSDSAGAALWAVDYMLHAATRGIRETYFHEGVGFKYNFFQPIALNRSIDDGSAVDPPAPPRVMPVYYGGLLVNTFVGRTGASQVTELHVNDTHVSGYAAFENGELARAAFVNLAPWLTSSGGDRPSVTLNLSFDGAQNRTVTAQRIVLGHADDRANLTWGGRSWETADALPSGEVVAEQVSLADGVQLRATEAILIDFTAAGSGTSPMTPDGAAGVGGSGNGNGGASSSGFWRSKGKYIVAGVVAGVVGAALCAAAVFYGRRRWARARARKLQNA